MGSSTSTTYLPTIEAYDRWAPYYDTDGNFLQKLDSYLLGQLLPTWTSSLPPSPSIIDLGCGTGRSTLQLLSVDGAKIIGLEPSTKMLDIARQRCAEALHALATSDSVRKAATLEFLAFDILSYEQLFPKTPVQAILSTLVLEHLPLAVFSDYCVKALMPGGRLLVTNMHADMGALSQAGFHDPETGQKVRPLSYIHTVADVVVEAQCRGLELVRDVIEKEVKDEDIKGMGLGERGRKWIGVKVWFCMTFVKNS